MHTLLPCQRTLGYSRVQSTCAVGSGATATKPVSRYQGLQTSGRALRTSIYFTREGFNYDFPSPGLGVLVGWEECIDDMCGWLWVMGGESGRFEKKKAATHIFW